MNILIANKFYYRRGGDCVYTLNLEKLLQDHGHSTSIFSMQYPDNFHSEWENFFPSEVKFSPNLGLIEAFRRPFGSRKVKIMFNKIINKFKPDIVHLNNIHSQLSPVIAEIAHQNNIKTIWTLHDYKLICPRYDFLNNNLQICEKCFHDNKSILKNKCMKGSMIASIIAYLESVKWNRKTIDNITDKFIAPSQFMADMMIKAGFNKEKIHVMHNFIDSSKFEDIKEVTRKTYYCYVGRISHEKGVETLIQAANCLKYKLKIIGSGPLEAELKKKANSNIEFLGYKNWDEIKSIISQSKFTVVPSEWYENNPFSIIESLCTGTPVLGANIGGIPELIDNNVNGMTFVSKDITMLKQKISDMFMHNFEYSDIKKCAIRKFNSESYYNNLINLYTK